MNTAPVEAVPLLLAKIGLPPLRAQVVPRARLLARVPWQPGIRLVLASAPAGFGKTTFLAAWGHALAQPDTLVAWYSLDETDNDPARFASYLVAALARAAAGRATDLEKALVPAMSLARAAAQTGAEPVLTALLNAVEAVPGRVVLVLDDYHAVAAPAVHAATAFLLEHLPAQMCLAIGSRADPALQLSRLRARGELVELRAADLRFTPAEVAAFFSAAGGMQITDDEARALEACTEGWAAGLQLVALSVPPAAGRAGLADCIARFGGRQRQVFDYLADEVFARQPVEVRRFVLATSVLERLSGSLCDAVTGRDDSDRMLERLERANLFVIPLDAERRWYRYHHLFTEFLREQAHREHAGDPVELHRRAAAWYEREGQTGEAVHHALAAGDTTHAAALTEAAAPALLARGERGTLLDWIAALPEADVRARPALCVIHAWALALGGRLAPAEARLADAEAAVRAAGEDTPAPLAGRIAAVRAHLSLPHGDPMHTVALCEAALATLPEDDPDWRGAVERTLAHACWWRGEGAAACEAMAAASETQLAAGNAYEALLDLRLLGKLQTVRGGLHAAEATYTHALRLAAERGWQRCPAAGLALVGLGDLLRERNRLSESARQLTEGLALGRPGADPEILVNGCILLARVRLASGDVPGAREAAEEAERVLRATGIAEYMAALKEHLAWLAIAEGRRDAVEAWVRACGMHPGDEVGRQQEFDYMVFARALLATDRPAEAEALLARMLPQAEREGRLGHVVEMQVLRGWALHALGDPAGARAALTRALALAEPEGYVRVFLDAGPVLRAPLARVDRADVLATGVDAPRVETLLAYRDRLLAALGDGAPRGSTSRVAPPESLTARELEVLRLIAAGVPNREIAERLVISIGTVKGHTHRIFGKLEARNRTEAVARARALGLL